MLSLDLKELRVNLQAEHDYRTFTLNTIEPEGRQDGERCLTVQLAQRA